MARACASADSGRIGPQWRPQPYRGTVGNRPRVPCQATQRVRRVCFVGPRVPFNAVLSIMAVVMTLPAVFGQGWPGPTTVLGVVVGLLPWALTALGVRIPLLAFVGLSLAAAVMVVVFDRNPGGMFPLYATVVLVTKSTDDWWAVGGIAVAAVGIISALGLLERSADESGLAYFAGGVGISALSGRMLRRQELLTDELRAMQVRALEHAADAERTRIAREVHDVVAHSLTVVMLHLTGARRTLASDPARADEALARAEGVGRESLDSVRQVVGLLRSGEVQPAQPAEPQPGLAELDSLVARYRSAGLDVSTEIALGEPVIDTCNALIVYRVVQESLSNAMQHAPGSSCSVGIAVRRHLGRGEAVVEVVVESTAGTGEAGRQPVGMVRSGLGLRGMHERVTAAGGELSAGRNDGGGWRVAATLPIGPWAPDAGSDQRSWTASPTAG